MAANVGDVQLTAAFAVEAAAADSRSPMRKLVWPKVLGEVLGGIEERTCLKHHDIETTFRQNLGGHTTCCTRPHDANVVNLW